MAEAFRSFVVFAEMRTGSNFLESNLNQIPGVKCWGEAFNPHFIGHSNKMEMAGVKLAERHAEPRRLLAAMMAETTGISGFRYFHDHDPRVFDLVMDDPACAKIILTRNALDSYISLRIAQESDRWMATNTKRLEKVHPRFEGKDFQKRVGETQAFQRRLMERLQKSGQTAFYIDYDDILDLDVLNGIAAYLGVEGRLKAVNQTLIKQNPSAAALKVSNPEEMRKFLAGVDWWDVDTTPNFEPRRQPAVALYWAGAEVPLLYMAARPGPEDQIRAWLGQYGEVLGDFDRKSLRKWRDAHGQHRSFTVLRHPLARAHSAFADLLLRDWMPELRPFLKKIHGLDLPEPGGQFATLDDHRAAFQTFLIFVRQLLDGQTGLRTPAPLASLTNFLSGFAQLQTPDLLIREERLETGLRFLCNEVGVAFQPLPEAVSEGPVPLTKVWTDDIEVAVRRAYHRDYENFGFGDWTPGQAA